MFSALILAGGSSSRMNGINKQLAILDGIPVIIRSLLSFQRSEMVSGIILTVPAGEEEYYRSLCKAHNITKLSAVTAGGSTRAVSVRNALAFVPPECEYIAIHDGARPLITTADTERVLSDAVEYGASIAAAPVTDTIKQCSGGCVEATPDRSSLFAAQTPQAFRKSLYVSCVEQLGGRADSLTDDSALLELCGERVHVTPVTACNMKITRPQDIAIAQAVLRQS